MKYKENDQTTFLIKQKPYYDIVQAAEFLYINPLYLKEMFGTEQIKKLFIKKGGKFVISYQKLLLLKNEILPTLS